MAGIPLGRATSITITPKLQAILDEVRFRRANHLPEDTRSDQKLILWLAEVQAQSLLERGPRA